MRITAGYAAFLVGLGRSFIGHCSGFQAVLGSMEGCFSLNLGGSVCPGEADSLTEKIDVLRQRLELFIPSG